MNSLSKRLILKKDPSRNSGAKEFSELNEEYNREHLFEKRADGRYYK